MHNVINVCRSNSAYWWSSFGVGDRSVGGSSGPSDATDQVAIIVVVVDSFLSSLSNWPLLVCLSIRFGSGAFVRLSGWVQMRRWQTIHDISAYDDYRNGVDFMMWKLINGQTAIKNTTSSDRSTVPYVYALLNRIAVPHCNFMKPAEKQENRCNN